jgi:hypothetical protein
MSTVDGDGSAVWVAAGAEAPAAADGAGLAVALHAVASRTTTAPSRNVLLGVDPGRFIALVSSNARSTIDLHLCL